MLGGSGSRSRREFRHAGSLTGLGLSLGGHRYHGVFAPNHRLRKAVTALAKRECR